MSAPLTRAGALAALGGALAGPALVRPAAAQAPATIKLALIPIEPTCQAYYAQENGFFEKAGLDVQVAVSQSTPAIAAAILSGTYDIAYSTVSTLATAHSKGLPVTIIAPGGLINSSTPKPIAGIVVGAGTGIQNAKDFNGKTFGTSALNTLAEYVPRAWVDKHGGDSNTIKFVEIPFPAIPDALASGRIDGGYLVEPFLSIALKGGAKFLNTGEDAIAPVYLASCWYATTPWVKAHPDLVTRFAGAMAEAGKWANANPAKVVPIIANHLKSDPAVLASTTRTVFADRLVAAQIQPWIDVTARYAKFPPFPAAELVYVPSGKA